MDILNSSPIERTTERRTNTTTGDQDLTYEFRSHIFDEPQSLGNKDDRTKMKRPLFSPLGLHVH